MTFEERVMKAYLGIIGRGARAFCLDVSTVRNGGGRGTPEEPAGWSDFQDVYDAMQSGRGDTILLLGGPPSDNSTGMTVRLASAFNWSKHMTHLIGLCAETDYGQRARITGPAAGGTFSPLFTVSANGCRFKNFSIFDDYTVDPVAMKVSGQRNYFENVNLQGMGAATGADDAAAASLWLYGAAENRFRKCVIGLDTVPRSTTNGEILMEKNASNAACKRNHFDECHIKSYCDNAGHLFVSATVSGCLDRETRFDHCIFENCPTGIASGLTMTQAMSVHATAGGMIILNEPSLIGATDWAAADNGNVIVNGTQPTAGSVGIAVAVTR